MARSSKDIAKRLRFDRRPRPDAFRRWYWAVAVLAAALAAGTWVVMSRLGGERQYLPGPLTAAHATFGDRCAHCHVAFDSVPNDKCLACHAPRVHSPVELATPRCAACHVEHRAPDLLAALSDAECVACHRELRASHALAVAARIASFADHPELTPLREGAHDGAALRFNHRLHLTSDNVREPPGCLDAPAPLTCREVGEALACGKCHVVDATGRYMLPIDYQRHCRRCHELKVTQQADGDSVPAPIDALVAPHAAPPAIHEALLDALLSLGARRPGQLFAADKTVLLPGRSERGAIDQSRSLDEFARSWRGTLEAALYRPFSDAAPLLDNNKHCFLCHIEGSARDALGLPTVVETRVPKRWLMRGEFSHRKHDRLPCATCHEGAAGSALTGEINLPRREVCAQCHADARPQSAGTACTLCHLYHDTSRDPARRAAPAQLSLDVLLGNATPSGD